VKLGKIIWSRLRSPGRAGRQVRRVGVIVAISSILLGLVSAPAYASIWGFQDGFENNPTGTWHLEHYGNSNAGFDLNAGTARSGANDAWLTSQTSFASVGRTVHLTPAQFHASTCAGQIFVQSLGTAKVNFEIINPTSWTYIALETVTLSGGGYTAVEVGPWTPGPVDVYVRLSLLGNGGFSAVRVDDMQVQCSYA
jgi:hypothetical protein